MRPVLAVALLPLLLGGCASLSTDGGLAPVKQATQARLGKTIQMVKTDSDRTAVDQRLAELLAAPLDADTAVQIALLNHRGLQASFQALGIADAERVQAGRLPNPGLSLARLRRGDEREIERSLGFNLGALIALPLTRQMEDRRLAAQQAEVAMAVFALAAESRKAFYAAVATGQTARYLRDVKASADAGAELARRMAQTGNWNKLQQAREHGFYAEAVLKSARAEAASVAARERLIRLLGLWGAQTQFVLPDRLPDLPSAPQDRPDIEQLAISQRLDVQAARQRVEAMASNLGLTRVTRFVNVLEFGYERNSANDQPRQTGYEISFEIPLFDWGDARIARAEAIYMQSVQHAAQTAIEARSEVREAYLGYRSRYDIARHVRDDIVPTAKRISDENLLRYNGMFISVFELLADARAQISAVNASIEALRDFWMAEADLDMALIGKPRLSAAGPLAEADAAGASPAH